MPVKFGCKTDIGLCRKNNEDSVDSTAFPFFTCLSVCDGIGGHKKGEVASQSSIKLLKEELNNLQEEDLLSHKKIIKQIDKIIEKINLKIFSISSTNPVYSGMGTTLCMALRMDEYTYVANVGDSRVYMLDYDDEFTSITRDDNVYNMMVDKGEIDCAVLLSDRIKRALTQSIGLAETINPNINRIDNDYKVLLVCTDGLYTMVSDEEIKQVLKNKKLSVKEKIDALINKANENGGKDNIGVSLLEVN